MAVHTDGLILNVYAKEKQDVENSVLSFMLLGKVRDCTTIE